MDDPQAQAPDRQPLPAQPDKTMAVLAFIFAFFIPLLGLILSLINLSKYPKGVEGHGLNKAALIISIILTLLLPLLIFAGSLAYLGVMETSSLLPERCQFGSELTCEDWTLVASSNPDKIIFQVTNELPERLHVNSIEYRVTNDAAAQPLTAEQWSECGNSGLGAVIEYHDDHLFTCELADGSLQPKEQQRVQLRLSYSTGGTSYDEVYGTDMYGEIYGKAS